MSPLTKGALVEYGTSLLGPLKNVVIFQFNPENLTRTIHIPERSTGKNGPEASQTSSPPTEKISFSAFFNAADLINIDDAYAKEFGVSSQLAALEKMVYPSNFLMGAIGKAIDAIGNLLLGKSKRFDIPIPRLENPRILFIWGKTRILPVLIESMTITERQYNRDLNPIEAEVSLSLAVLSYDSVIDDEIAKGALKYSTMVKEAQTLENLRKIPTQIKDYILF